MDYLVSSIPSKVFVSDPVVVAIPIGWMKKIVKYQDAFDIFMDNMYSEERFNEYDYIRHSYTQSQNGHAATTDDLMGWISATKKMIEEEAEGPAAWDYMRKNIPPDIMMGFDMEIGGSNIGAAFRKLLKNEEFKNVDRLIIPIHDIIDADGNKSNNDILSMLSSNHIDDERTIKIMSNGGSGDAIMIGVISNNSIDELFTRTGLMPKGLYRLINLSDVILNVYPSSINYNILKI